MSSDTFTSTRAPQNGQSVAPKKRAYAGTTGETMLLHVNLPASLVKAVRGLAHEERRTITSQVALLLEESPELVDYQRATPNPMAV